MFKHVIGQAIFQVFVMMIIVFAGDQFLPEWSSPGETILMGKTFGDPTQGNYSFYSDSIVTQLSIGLVASGREKMIGSADDDYARYEEAYGPSRHFTYLFNIFVLMQISNFFNARKLEDEFWVLEGVTRSGYFIFIVSAIIVAQVK